MKVADILSESSETVPLIGTLLLKLQKAGQPMKVSLRGLKETVYIGGKQQVIPIEDALWDVTAISLMKFPSGDRVRVRNKSPDEWFELVPEDDEILVVKKHPDGYWVLQQRDGLGFKP